MQPASDPTQKLTQTVELTQTTLRNLNDNVEAVDAKLRDLNEKLGKVIEAVEFLAWEIRNSRKS